MRDNGRSEKEPIEETQELRGGKAKLERLRPVRDDWKKAEEILRTPNKMNVWTNCHSERSEESGFCCKYQAFHFVHCCKYLILLDALRQLGAAVEQSIDGIAMGVLEPPEVSPTLTYVNEAFAKMHGYSCEEMIGMKVRDLHSKQQMREFDSKIRRIITEGSWQGEFNHLKKDGTSFPTYMSVNSYKSEQGTPTIIAVCRDITERKKAEEKLHLYGEIITNMSEGVYAIRAGDGVVFYTNPKFEEMFGYGPGELIGKHVSVVNAPGAKTPEETAVEIMKILNKQGSWQGEICNIKKDGTPFWCYASVSVFEHPEHGKVLVSTHTDITEHKMFETEQELTIELLRLLNANNQKHELMRVVTKFLKGWFQCEAVGIRLQEGEDFPYSITSGFPEEFIQAENYLCSVNELGEIERDIQGRPYLECMCGNIISGRFDPSKPFFTEHGSFWTNSTTELLSSTTEHDRLARTRNRCNTDGYESVALVPLRSGNETFGLLQLNDKHKGCFTPEKISLLERLADNLAIGLAQRRAEEALRESEDRYRDLFEEANDVILAVDSQGGIIDINRCAEELTGFTRQELLARNVLQDLIIPEDREHIRQVIANLMKGQRQEYEVRWRAKDGTIIQFEGSSSARMTEEGQFVCTRCILHDVTKRKKASEAVLEYQVKLKSLASELSLAEERERRRIADGIHDDIGTKLAVAKFELQSLMEGPAETAIATSLDSVCAEIDKVIEDAHSLTFELSNPVLYEVGLDAAVESWLGQHIDKKSRLRYEVASEPSPMKPDVEISVVLFRVIRELLSNVIKHADASLVQVNIQKDGETIRVSIEDDGAGFEVSEPGLPVKETGGFGLFSVRERIEYLSGKIEIESRPGQGTFIKISVPVQKSTSR